MLRAFGLPADANLCVRCVEMIPTRGDISTTIAGTMKRVAASQLIT